MSPVPTMPGGSRFAAIQSRIASLQGIVGGASSTRLAPDTHFADQLAAQQTAQAGTGQAAATPEAGTGTLPTTLPTGVLPTTPTTTTGSTSTAAVPGYYSRPAGLGVVADSGPLGRPGSSTAVAEAVRRDALPAGAQDVGEAVVALAQREIGTPYVWGGESHAEGGFDCSGLVLHAYGQLGIELPRVSRDQATIGEPVASLEEAIPGDLVAFGSPVDHIGIYAGDGMMVVAPHTGAVVRMQEITQTPTAIRRVVPAGTVVTEGGTAGAADAATRAAGPVGADVPFAALFNAAGARHGVDPRLLAAVARAESAYNPTAVSPAGAQGLMQIMPATAAGLGVDPLVPEQAVDGAARYLAEQLDAFGTVELALAAYNAGPGNVRRYGGIPPFTETRNYVQRVTDYLGALQ